MKVVAIIQARMGSTRLPGKVMKQLDDRTVLGHVITRCQAIASIDQVMVVTTKIPEDEAICKEAERYGVKWFCGSEQHVLSRYYEAAKAVEADIIVRITSDCPLLDPEVSNSVIKSFLQKECDYMSTGLSQTYPRGLDTEVFSFRALERSYQEAKLPYEQEHVTPYIYSHPEIFDIEAFFNKENQSEYRLTLDTEQDWNLIKTVYSRLYQGCIFGLQPILELFEKEPHLPLINKNVQQKKLGE